MQVLSARLYSFKDKEIKDQLESDRFFKEPKSGDNLGYENLEGVFTSKAGEHCIVYGAPNSGKTSFVYNVAVNQAKDGLKYLIWGPEEFSPQHIYKKLAYIYAGKHYEQLDDTEQQEVENFLQNHFHVLDTPRLGVTWKLLKDGIEGLNISYDAIIFDHLMMIEPETDLPHEQNVRALMSNVIDFCKLNQVFIWLINHTIKPQQYIDSKSHFSYIPPQDPSQMAHGQMWYRLCFNCIEIYRPTQKVYNSKAGEVWVNVRKVKNPDVGREKPIGSIRLLYNVDRHQYVEDNSIEDEDKYS